MGQSRSHHATELPCSESGGRYRRAGIDGTIYLTDEGKNSAFTVHSIGKKCYDTRLGMEDCAHTVMPECQCVVKCTHMEPMNLSFWICHFDAQCLDVIHQWKDDVTLLRMLRQPFAHFILRIDFQSNGTKVTVLWRSRILTVQLFCGHSSESCRMYQHHHPEMDSFLFG